MKAISSSIILRNVFVPAALVGTATGWKGETVGDRLWGDLVLIDGKVAGMVRAGNSSQFADAVELHGGLVTPTLVEAHCHLDKCHTFGRLAAAGGHLFEAIAKQKDDRRNWSRQDIRVRAERGLVELFAAGCRVVRTHVDWDPAIAVQGQPPLAWQVLGELAEEWRDRLVLQRAALLSAACFDDDDYVSAASNVIRSSLNGVLGMFLHDWTNRPARIAKALELAHRDELALDFHIDEGLGDDQTGLIAALEVMKNSRPRIPVLFGHACSLINLSGSTLDKVLSDLAETGAAVVSLPTTNLYLQGRCSGTPIERGITRLRELADAGVPTAIGSDNVCDAFCPVGRHDPRFALATAVLVGHLDPPLGPWLRTITTNATRALGLAPQTIDGADTSQLLVSQAGNTAEFLTGTVVTPLDVLLASHVHQRRLATS